MIKFYESVNNHNLYWLNKNNNYIGQIIKRNQNLIFEPYIDKPVKLSSQELYNIAIFMHNLEAQGTK